MPTYPYDDLLTILRMQDKTSIILRLWDIQHKYMQINQTYIAARLSVRVRIRPRRLSPRLHRHSQKERPALESQACLILLPFCGVHSILLLSFLINLYFHPSLFVSCSILCPRHKDLKPSANNLSFQIELSSQFSIHFCNVITLVVPLLLLYKSVK